mgnify:FL=1|jgi:hypothetical protein|tara:strand:- start:68 stop:250 length:183 start_codon:yes stop_codon:yes gene_type:complete
MKITREMMMSWAETYDEAIDTLLWVANDGYTQDDMRESLEQCFIDNGLMSEEEFRKEING